jgi:hypothetical protein
VLLLGNLEFTDRDVSGTPHAEVRFRVWGFCEICFCTPFS